MVLLVLGVVVISGCTVGGGGGGAPSITISNFGPVTIGTQGQPVRNGRPVTLTAVFRNDGGAIVDGGTARLIGLGSDWQFNDPSNRQHSFSIKPGQEVMKRWKVTSPGTSGYEFDITYPVEVRYEFDYGTVFRGVFSWLSQSEYDRVVDSGDQALIDETLSGRGLTVEKSSLGPVNIDIETVEFIEFPEVKLTIKNNGKGHLQNNRVSLRPNNLNCEESGDVELINNQFETYCTIDKAGSDEVPTDILVEINYDYYVSANSDIYYHDTGK